MIAVKRGCRPAIKLAVKRLFRNAAHSERPTEPVSNSKNPAFYGISESECSKKVRIRGWYGEGSPKAPSAITCGDKFRQPAMDARNFRSSKSCNSLKSSITGTLISLSVYPKVARPIYIRCGHFSSTNTRTLDLKSRSASSLEIVFTLLPSDRCVASRRNPQRRFKAIGLKSTFA
ncbi:MAG TPA: hypothetical protein DDZ51_21785 [Planctomycetaceae bacterium]|nr:hypothetical protein [Planctomycetaceae bacterium]